jgi:hypothetical protein
MSQLQFSTRTFRKVSNIKWRKKTFKIPDCTKKSVSAKKIVVTNYFGIKEGRKLFVIAIGPQHVRPEIGLSYSPSGSGKDLYYHILVHSIDMAKKIADLLVKDIPFPKFVHGETVKLVKNIYKNKTLYPNSKETYNKSYRKGQKGQVRWIDFYGNPWVCFDKRSFEKVLIDTKNLEKCNLSKK